MRRTASSLGISLGLHAVALTFLFLLRFSSRGAPKDLPDLRRATFIIAPVPVERLIAPRPTPALSIPSVVTTELPRGRRMPTEFPTRAIRPMPETELPAAPVLEALRVTPSELKVSLPVLPPPPFKTANLAATMLAIPVATSSSSVRAAGFSGAQPGAREPTQGPVRMQSLESFGGVVSARVPRPQEGTVARGGFPDVAFTPPSPVAVAPRVSSAVSMSAIEILFKPRPAYTEEARRLQIEGEVLLELLFASTGEVRVLRVMRGLGYGLDETATNAARAIRFHPASRAGVPVDFIAPVHIVFQLAY